MWAGFRERTDRRGKTKEKKRRLETPESSDRDSADRLQQGGQSLGTGPVSLTERSPSRGGGGSGASMTSAYKARDEPEMHRAGGATGPHGYPTRPVCSGFYPDQGPAPLVRQSDRTTNSSVPMFHLTGPHEPDAGHEEISMKLVIDRL
ncbi:hypothetical protein VDGL01_08725 [Verticillium dahliae]